MTKKGFSAVEQQPVVKPKTTPSRADLELREMQREISNLRTCYVSMMETYVNMHSTLARHLKEQLGFDADRYFADLKALNEQTMKTREAVEDARMGVVRVEGPVQQYDLVRLIIDGCIDGHIVSNRDVGGQYYVIGREQILPEIDKAVVDRCTGEKFDVTLTYTEEDGPELAGKNMVYTVEVVAIKRKQKSE